MLLRHIRADYAIAAAVLLTSEGHEGKVYELAGDSAYTLAQFASEIGVQTGDTVRAALAAN